MDLSFANVHPNSAGPLYKNKSFPAYRKLIENPFENTKFLLPIKFFHPRNENFRLHNYMYGW